MKKLVLCILVIFTLFQIHIYGEETISVVGSTAILIDVTSGRILYEKNSDEHYDAAGLNKLITAYMAVEKLSPEQKLTMNVATFQTYDHHDGVLWIQNEETLSLSDVLNAVVLQGYNDAVALLADALSHGVENHINDLNVFCKQLNMTETMIKNCFGMADIEQFTTVKDLSLFMRKALANPTFKSIMHHRAHTIYETNKFNQARTIVNEAPLWKNEVLADKLQFAKQSSNEHSGVALMGGAKYQETELLAIVLGESDSNVAQDDIVKLLNYGLQSYRTAVIKADSIGEKEVKVYRYKRQIADVKFSITGDFKVLLPINIDVSQIKTEIVVNHEDADNPNDVLADVVFKLNDEIVGKLPMKKDVVIYDNNIQTTKFSKIVFGFEMLSMGILLFFLLRELILQIRRAMATPQE